MLVGHRIAILLQETLDFVGNIKSIMSNSEGSVAEPWLLENLGVLRLGELVMELLQEGLVGTRGKTRFFVEERHDTKLALDDVDARLVVGELDERPVDLLPHIFFLLKLEDVSVELTKTVNSSFSAMSELPYLLLQLLVCIVDTELLETVEGVA